MRSLLAVALVAASASAASAGTYLGLGIGTAASPGGDLTMTSSDGNRSGRAIVGMSFGRLSVEGNADRFGLFLHNTWAYQGTMIAAAVKYSLPLGDNFEAFGRAGLERTWLNTDVQAIEYAGNGWLLGAGFEYRLNLAGTGASLFVDYQHTDTGLVNQTDMRTTKDEAIGLWTAGVTVSL